MLDEGKPIFLQIAEQIENDIIAGTLAEESQAPSTNEFATFYRINPATAGKGVNRLVDDGILYKKEESACLSPRALAPDSSTPAQPDSATNSFDR